MRKISILLVFALMFSIVPVCAEDAVIIDTYSWTFSRTQGSGNWRNVMFENGEAVDLPFDSASGRYRAPSGYPIIEQNAFNTGDNDMAYMFTAPVKGMVRLRGTISQPTADSARGDGINASIYKNQTALWSSNVTYSSPAEYDITTSVRAGDKLYFRANKRSNNGFDWSQWFPKVEYLGIEYVNEGSLYKHYEKHGDILKELNYNEDTEKYTSSDCKAFLDDYKIMPSSEYALVRRYTVTERGRYRVQCTLSSDDIRGGHTKVTVLKNGEEIQRQLFLDDETSSLDVRMYAQPNDLIDIEVIADDFIGYNQKEWSCGVTKYIAVPSADVNTSYGYSYQTVSKEPLSSYIGVGQGINGTEVYTIKYDVRIPMKYQSGTSRWESTIENDGGYVSNSIVFPGRHTESAFEITVRESGVIKIDGKLGINTSSDGVVVKINHNGRTIWSSRVGEEKAVKWDEPYDTSYFSYNVNTTAKVNKGDKLEFTFNQWRKTANDIVNIDNINVSYVKGGIVSETTKWKLDNSIVIDTVNKTLRQNGATEPVNVLLYDGTAYISTVDASKAFGSEFVPEAEINGYVPVRSAAENTGKSVVWAADRLVIIHSGIPVMFGWSELSEVNTALQGGILFE